MAMEIAVLDYASLVAAHQACRPQGSELCHSRASSDATCQEQSQGEVLARLMDALGPQGPGLVTVRGVPGYESLREELLRMARTLALMPRMQRNSVLKENGLGTDVPMKDPNRAVSSFAAQLQFSVADMFDVASGQVVGTDSTDMSAGCGPREWDYMKGQMQHLGWLFRQLGLSMVKLGLLVAALCDQVVRGAGLEEAILSAGTAKGRLIHYHSAAEGCNHSRKQAPGKVSQPPIPSQEQSAKTQEWQDWHLDYGVFTILTSPLFCKLPAHEDSTALNQAHSEGRDNKEALPCSIPPVQGCPPPDGHSHLQILHCPTNRLQFIDIPPDCLAIQVGEAAQILSGGKLRATAHCVSRPSGGDQDISRNTFAVFLQPSWDKPLVNPQGCDRNAVLQAHPECSSQFENLHLSVSKMEASTQILSHISKVIPPLSSRWSDGCTFADFSRKTTSQYYGAAGRQSKLPQLV